MNETELPHPQGARHSLWIGFSVPLVAAATFVVLVVVLRPYGVPTSRLLILAVAPAALAGALLASAAAVITRYRRRLERSREELVALHRGARDIYDELSLDHVLQTVVDRARPLVEARYGALSVIEGDGRILAFVTSGITAEERARIGDPPRGEGLLGVPLEAGETLRVPEIAVDPRSVGFPPNHPPMRSLLAVPVRCRAPFRGNLYVAEKQSAREFGSEDEATLQRFALTAGLAIDVAFTHRRLSKLAVAEERARIAREMHDGVAQVLAYVGTKAQAVDEYLARGRHDEARRQLEQLAEAAREVSVEVREGIQALRTDLAGQKPLAEILTQYADHWQRRSGVAIDVRVDEGLRWTDTVELQVVRIVQEALSNVRKHAGAEQAWVEIRREGDRAVVEVRDDGVGFDPQHPRRRDFPRFGLAMMRERAESIGGEIEFLSRPGSGTRVRLQAPLVFPQSRV